jgi:hypothetical protein
MKKTAALIATLITPLFLLPLLLAAALVTESCGNGESVGNSTSSSSGGSTGSSSGGSGNPFSGSGGSFVNLGSGGANVNQGSGGATTSSSGGSSTSGSGGATTSSASGGSPVIVGTSSGGSPIITGGGGTTGGGSSTFVDGYGTNSTWKGFVSPTSWGTATISPTKFAAGSQVCVMGSVPADLTGGSGALVAWNIDEPKPTSAVPTPAVAVAPTGTGLAVMLTGTVTGLRVQIEDATQKTKWCALVTGPNTMIPWTSFNTACWDPATGVAYSPASPILDIAVVVPSAGMVTMFNFCWISANPY